jgi:hypothetical protein
MSFVLIYIGLPFSSLSLLSLSLSLSPFFSSSSSVYSCDLCITYYISYYLSTLHFFLFFSIIFRGFSFYIALLLSTASLTCFIISFEHVFQTSKLFSSYFSIFIILFILCVSMHYILLTLSAAFTRYLFYPFYEDFQ